MTSCKFGIFFPPPLTLCRTKMDVLLTTVFIGPQITCLPPSYLHDIYQEYSLINQQTNSSLDCNNFGFFTVSKLYGFWNPNKREDYGLEMWVPVTKEHYVWVYKRMVWVPPKGGGEKGLGKNSALLLVYSSVQTGHRERQESVNRDYSNYLFCSSDEILHCPLASLSCCFSQEYQRQDCWGQGLLPWLNL